jgi:AcrR family transcriptional regulator
VVPRSGNETRIRLLDAAERRFAADGISGATFADIIDDAGQRNNSAIQYHFGDRMGLLEAVIGRRSEELAVRREEMAGRLPSEPTPRQVVEVIVVPLAAMLDRPGGVDYLRIQAELLAHPARDTMPTLLTEPWRRPGFESAGKLLVESLPEHCLPMQQTRRILATTLVFHALADRARTARPGDDHDHFVRSLVAATVAVVEVPMD